MQVRLLTSIEVIALNLKLAKDTVFNVTEVTELWYICQNEEVCGIYIPKEFCEVLK